MSAVALAFVLLASLGLLAVSLNHLLARVGIIELALSQGYPRNAAPSAPAEQQTPGFDAVAAADALPADSLNLFVSATCVSCARLVDDLAAPELILPFDLNLHFSEHRSPLARHGTVHENQAPLFARLAVPATPYAVELVDGSVSSHGGVADIAALALLIDWQPCIADREGSVT
jgi:hypothetical protein